MTQNIRKNKKSEIFNRYLEHIENLVSVNITQTVYDVSAYIRPEDELDVFSCFRKNINFAE